MKYLPSIAFNEMSGSAKGVTAAKVLERKYIRNRGSGGKTRTNLQSTVKSIFRQLSQSWKSLTEFDRQCWTVNAQYRSSKSVLGQTAKITGPNWYMRANYWILRCGGKKISAPYSWDGVEAPADGELGISSNEFSFHLMNQAEVDDNIKLVVMCSAPQGAGITDAYYKAVMIGDPIDKEEFSDDNSVDLFKAYTKYNDLPSKDNPKIFCKYFFVNSKTGEKSEVRKLLYTYK